MDRHRPRVSQIGTYIDREIEQMIDIKSNLQIYRQMDSHRQIVVQIDRNVDKQMDSAIIERKKYKLKISSYGDEEKYRQMNRQIHIQTDG